MRYAEKWGDSVDIAVELALIDLKLTREQVDVTVLEEPSKGFFGLGSKLAKVRVEEKTQKTEPVQRTEKKPETIERTEKRPEAREWTEKKPEAREWTEKRPERKVEIKREGNQEILIEVCGVDDNEPARFAPLRARRDSRKDRPRREFKERDILSRRESKVLTERPADLIEDTEHAASTFLTDVTREMGLNVNVRVFKNAESVYIDIDGEDSGTIIGKRGQTLDAIQYLTSLVVNKEKENYLRVVIDAEGYREKREKTLEKLANRLADKAKKSGRSVRLEPMNPYERKVIHTALQNRPEVTTRSEGEEPYRRVIIEPSK
jgi:spoIIIJ-associated protein